MNIKESIKEILELTNELHEIRKKYKEIEKRFWKKYDSNYYTSQGGYTKELERNLFDLASKTFRKPQEKEIKVIDEKLKKKFGIVYGCEDYGSVDYCMDEIGITKLCRMLLK